MSAGSYTVGLLCLLAVGASLLACSRALRVRLAPAVAGAPGVLADLVLALAALVVLSQLLGTVGAFSRPPLVVATLALCAGALLWLRRGAARPARETAAAPAAGVSEPAASRGMIAAALGAGVLVLAQWGAGVRAALEQGMILPDTLWYHLPFAARFSQDGWLTRLHYAETEPVTAFYPANAELFHAVGMELFGRDVLSPYLNMGIVALALLAGWCIGRARGAGPLGLVGAALALSVPIVWGLHAGQAGNDAVGTAFLLAAVGLLLCAEGRGPLLWVAGLAAGLALGTKLSMVAPVLALSLAVVLIAGRGARARTALAWGAPMLVTGAFWYLRNLLRTGSPLPWVSFDLGPVEFQAPSRMLTEGLEFSVAHYAGRPGIWRQYFLPDLEWALGSAWPALLLLAAAAVIACVLTRDIRVRALGLVAGTSALAYLFTPNGAAGRDGFPWGFGLNLRYAVPALALALALLSLAPFLTTPRRRALALALMVVVLVINLFSPSGLWSYRRDEALVIGAVLLIAGAGLLLVHSRVRRPLRAAALLGFAALLAAGGFAAQRDYVRDRYAEVGPNVPRASVWAQSVRDARIGVLGFTPQYPLYGRDLSNRVEQIGRPGPRGAFARLSTCGEWRRAVNAGGYGYLVVAPVQSPNLPPVPPRREAREAAWTRADPAASELVRDGKVSVFRLEGRLDTSCP